MTKFLNIEQYTYMKRIFICKLKPIHQILFLRISIISMLICDGKSPRNSSVIYVERTRLRECILHELRFQKVIYLHFYGLFSEDFSSIVRIYTVLCPMLNMRYFDHFPNLTSFFWSRISVHCFTAILECCKLTILSPTSYQLSAFNTLRPL